jgi:hypothetical protein
MHGFPVQTAGSMVMRVNVIVKLCLKGWRQASPRAAPGQHSGIVASPDPRCDAR